jgi:hypothetical protein
VPSAAFGFAFGAIISGGSVAASLRADHPRNIGHSLRDAWVWLHAPIIFSRPPWSRSGTTLDRQGRFTVVRLPAFVKLAPRMGLLGWEDRVNNMAERLERQITKGGGRM